MSDEEKSFEMSTTGLDKLLKALKGTPPVVRVGILGAKNQRTVQGTNGLPSNATIGMFHEFGTEKLPVRSFLRMPLTENLDQYLEKSGAFDKDVQKEVIKEGSIVPWMEKVAVVAESVVADAFDTGGFGKWPASNMTGKENHQTLVETQQLRNAITSEVKG